MEQDIRFCKTKDGVRIAFSVMGEGPSVLRIPGWTSHLEMEWKTPILREGFERWAKHFTYIRLDKRGTGLSDREQSHDLDARISDIEAVVDHLELPEVSLVGLSEGGPASIGFAARHPDRVVRMALYGTWARGDALYGGSALREAVMSVVKAEWGMGSKLLTELFTGDEGDSFSAQAFTIMQRVGATASDAYRMLEEDAGFDLTGLLPQITAPTLVVHARDDRVVPVELGLEVAAGIPNARLTLIDGPHRQFMELDHMMLEFMTGKKLPLERADTAAAEGALRTVLFTDLVGHTEMMQRLGDDRGRDVLREHERITREALAEYSGDEIKTMGDGFMVSFGSVTGAVECAIALQRRFAEYSEGADEPIRVRAGLNAGEPIEEDGDLFGSTVILASRIAAKAAGGEILVANAIRELSSGKGFLFNDRGEFVAKGFEEPVRLYEVSWREG